MRLFAPLYERALQWARHQHAPRYLAALSFAESSFFPVPPDVMLAPMALAQPQRAWALAWLTTWTSVAGGLLGYLIGWLAFAGLEPWLRASSHWPAYEQAVAWFSQWGVLAVFIAGFSPIPYKVFTIAAGTLAMPLLPFAAASLVGRGTRFFLVAGLMRWGGARMEAQLRQHIAAGWRLTGCDRDDAGAALLTALTTRHRLQPFAAAYFPATPNPEQPPPPGLPWFSYAHEWLPARQPRDDAATLPPWTPDAPLDTAQLGAFLRNPARAFFQQRLRVHLADAAPADDDRDILEPDGLSRWRIDEIWVATVVRQARAGAPLEAALAAAEAVWRRAIARGEWPPGTFGDTLAGDWNTQARRVWSLAGDFFRRHPVVQGQPDWLDEPAPGCDPAVRVRDALGPVHRAEDGTRARLLWQGSAVIENPSGNGGQYRLHTLTSAWVQHLAHHRAGGPLATWVLSPRGAVVLSPLSPEQADAAWEALLLHWRAGMSAPCRFEPKSAAAWLRSEERAGARAAWLAARLVYEGNEHQRGVLDTDPDWRRAYPDFAALAGPLEGAEHSPLAQTARALLRPLRDALSSPPRHDADDQP